MIKLFVCAIALAAFTIGSVPASAATTYVPCSNAPKNYIPCPTLSQAQQQSKTK
jgi:hypothetical protein